MTNRQAPERLDPLLDAVDALRALLLVSYSFRQNLAAALQLAISDTFALSHLAGTGSLTAGELAQRTGLAPSSVTAMLDRLERAELAQRTVQPADRRSQQITLTERGWQVLALSSGWAEAGFGAVPAELPMITRQLRAVAAALHNQNEAFSAALESGSIDTLLDRQSFGEPTERDAISGL
jgi:DNA-binding MarR family transcriptional regulator